MAFAAEKDVRSRRSGGPGLFVECGTGCNDSLTGSELKAGVGGLMMMATATVSDSISNSCSKLTNDNHVWLRSESRRCQLG
jgi:hypothetical protein